MILLNSSLPFIYLSLFVNQILSIPIVTPRTPNCFVTGPHPLPPSLASHLPSLSNSITCDPSHRTLSSIPDVSTSTTSFSFIDYSSSPLPPLSFAIKTFRVPRNPSIRDLRRLEEFRDLYLATEIAVWSEKGDLRGVEGLRVVRGFLELQILRTKRRLGVEVGGSDVWECMKKIEEMGGESAVEEGELEEVRVLAKETFGKTGLQRPLGMLGI